MMIPIYNVLSVSYNPNRRDMLQIFAVPLSPCPQFLAFIKKSAINGKFVRVYQI